MAWSVLQSAGAPAASTGSAGVAFGSNLSSGSKILCFIANNDATITSVKDTAGNSLTQVASVADTWSSSTGAMFVYAMDTPAGDAGATTTITVTTAAGNFFGIVIQEVAGLLAGTAGLVDGTPGTVTQQVTSASFTTSSPAYSSGAAGEYLVGFYGDDGSAVSSASAATGYSVDANSVLHTGDCDCIVARKNSAGGAESCAFTISAGAGAHYATMLLAFKLAGGAPSAGPVFRQASQAIRAKLPQPQACRAGLIYGSAARPGATENSLGTGRISFCWGAPVSNPVQGPVFRQAVRPVRAPVPQNRPGGVFGGYNGPGGGDTSFGSGRVMWSPGAPVNNPRPGPVFRQKPAPVRFILPPWQPRAGRIGSSFGAPAENPSHGPPVYAPQGPARARLPQLHPRAGRVTSNPGALVRNPSAGPAVYALRRPVRAAPPLPARGRVYVCRIPAATVTPPPSGPLSYPAVQAVRGRLPLQPLLRGRTASNAGGPLGDPSRGPAVYAPRGPVRSRTQPPFSKGRLRSSAGGPVQNPGSGPAFRQAVHPARAVIPQVFSKGRASGNPGAPVRNPSQGPFFPAAVRPCRALVPQVFSKGRVSSSAGATVQNPSRGPAFRQATVPARIRPSLPPRGRVASGAGGLVSNPAPPGPSVIFTYGEPYFEWAYGTPCFEWETGEPHFEWETGSPYTS